MTTINDLVVSNSFSPDDKLPMWSNANGVTRALPLSVLTAGFLTPDDINQIAASSSVETFTAGIDFTPGVTLALTLIHNYVSGDNIEVHFDAAFQGPDQFTLVAQTVTFTSPIPVGVSKVYVSGGAVRQIGAPSDSTVTTSTLVDKSVTTPKLDDDAVTASKLAAQSVNDASLISGSTVSNLVTNHWRVRTDGNTNYDGIDQSTFPEAPVLGYSSAESFGWSMRNSKHTAKEIYQSIFPGQSFFDGVQGVTSITAGTAIGQATGIAGYVKNRAAVSGINGNGVAVFGAATAEVDNAAVWGLNTLLQDSSTRTAGTGIGRILLGAELDFNVMNPGTQVIGVSIGGNSLAQPSNSNGFIANSLGNGNKWGAGFVTIDGAAFIAMSIGKAAAGNAANTASQPVYWQYVNGSSAAQNTQLQVFPGGGATGSVMRLTGTEASDIDVHSGVYRIAGIQVLSSQITGYGTPSGGSRISNFPGATATLLQTSQMLAQLMLDLKTHGLIGA